MQENEGALTYWVFGSVLAVLAYAGFSVRLGMQSYSHRRFDGIGFAMLSACLATLAWSLFSLFASVLGSDWETGVQVADVLRYFWWCAFVWLFLKKGEKEKLALAKRKFFMVFFAICLAGVLVVSMVNPVAGFMGNNFLMLILALVSLILVEQLFRNVPEDSVWSAKPVCLGLAGIFVFDLYVFSQGVLFKEFDSDALHARPFVHALMVPLLWLTTTRHKNWIDKIRVSRQVVFHSATLVLAGLYFLFIAGVGYYVQFFGAEWTRALQLGIIFVCLVLGIALALSGSLRARLRVFLNKHFFHYRFDYRKEWLKFTATLSSDADPQGAGLSVVRGLAAMLESPGGALWLLRQEEGHYRQVARWHLPAISEAEDHNGSLAAFMCSTQWVINLDEFRKTPDFYPHLTLPLWLVQLTQAWLIVPLWQGKDLLGFVLLLRPHTPIEVNWEVTDLLKTAGHQAASLLAQMQATEALLEARKFEAFTRMSAFVVHDLKNIIAQLSLMVKNAKRLQDNPEFQADMLMTVENSLERMKQLMLQLRGGASPSALAFGVDLAKVAAQLVASAQQRGRRVRLDAGTAVFSRGEQERLKRIIGHLVQNALDATQPEQAVWIRVFRAGSQACVEVGDEGCGMTEEFVETRLFKPFQTTKEAGMGIGSYESFQYVRELGGKVSVDSQQAQGTVITLLLPLVEISRASDLHRQEAA